MGDITIIRKRYIPNEEIDISNDRILVNTNGILITKWLPIHPRKDFAWGISYVDLKDNYKISRFYDKESRFLFWYCDVIAVEILKNGEDVKYVLKDLLIDIIVYPDGHYEIKDLDELEEALEQRLIDRYQYDMSIMAMNRLVENIEKGNFPPNDFIYKDFEKYHVDLHLHSLYSDGTMTPLELVQMAVKCNLSVISLTDHDSIDGVTEAAIAAEQAGIEFIPGVELSGDSLHIIGYFPDGGIEKLEGIFQTYRNNRIDRAKKIVDRLNGFNISITYEDIVKEAGGEKFIGRMHVAKALVRRGYANSVKEANSKWIGDGKKGYVKKEGHSVYEIIDIVNRNRGIPVLAHPGQIAIGKAAKERLIKDLAGNGLKGLEVYYTDNTHHETKEYMRIARSNRLIMTGGSDFHGSNKPDIFMGTGKGDLVVPYECAEDLRSVLKNYSN